MFVEGNHIQGLICLFIIPEATGNDININCDDSFRPDG